MPSSSWSTMPSTTLNMPQPSRAPPEGGDPDGDGDPGERMEEAVRKRVRLEARHRRGRVAALAAQHVVPLEDLVEDDAVDEPAEPDAEEDAGRARPDHRA